jgi:hypothetical protein
MNCPPLVYGLLERSDMIDGLQTISIADLQRVTGGAPGDPPTPSPAPLLPGSIYSPRTACFTNDTVQPEMRAAPPPDDRSLWDRMNGAEKFAMIVNGGMWAIDQAGAGVNPR